MSRRFIIALVFVLSAVFQCFAIDDADRMKALAEADKAMSENRWADAEGLILEALRLEPANPSNALLVSNLGMVRFYQGKDVEALETLDEAHDMAPASVTILTNRARVKTGLGKVNEAIEDYKEVCRLDSTLTQPLFTLGILQLQTGDIDAARENAYRLEKLAPDGGETHALLGSLAQAEGQWKEAVTQFRIAVRKDSCAEYWCSLAWSALRSDDLSTASEAISDGLRLDPFYAELYLARILLERARYRDADAKLAAAKAIDAGASPAEVRAFLQAPLADLLGKKKE